MAVISHGLILALLPHGWIHHSPTDSSMDFDKSPSDFGEPGLSDSPSLHSASQYPVSFYFSFFAFHAYDGTTDSLSSCPSAYIYRIPDVFCFPVRFCSAIADH